MCSTKLLECSKNEADTNKTGNVGMPSDEASSVRWFEPLYARVLHQRPPSTAYMHVKHEGDTVSSRVWLLLAYV